MAAEHGNWFIGLRVESEWPCPRQAPEAVRVFDPGDWHLTVAFLGACGSELAREVFAALAIVPFPGFDAELDSVVAMGNSQRYSALSALLGAGREPVEAWMTTARAEAHAWLKASQLPAAAQVRLDRRPMKAHLTVARPMRRASDAQREVALAWAKALPIAGVAVRMPSLALYGWSDDRKERLFEIVERRGV